MPVPKAGSGSLLGIFVQEVEDPGSPLARENILTFVDAGPAERLPLGEILYSLIEA